MSNNVLIIGAGIAGLTVGCYAQMNGYESQVFEMHNLPGGLCTAWKRSGYTFDGCIHWLVGSRGNTAMHDVWRTIGALKDSTIHHHEEFVRVTAADGRTAIQYTDLNRLQQHLLELSPDDHAIIRELVMSAKQMAKMEMPVGKPQELMGPLDTLKSLWTMRSFLGVMMKHAKVSIGEFTARFKDPLLKDLFTMVLDPRYNMVSLLATMGSLDAQDAGWPQGGSLPFAQRTAAHYEALGGQIHYRSKVTKILVEGRQATGIELESGEQVRGRVVSAADGYTTLYRLLGEEFVPESIANYYTDQYPTMTSVLVYMGVNYDLSDVPHSIAFELDTPLELGGQIHHHIGFKHYCYDASLTPPGKSVVAAVLYTESDYWETLVINRKSYEAEKDRIGREVVAEFERRFPETAGQVEMIDVATPVTLTRYPGVYKGDYMSWINTPAAPFIRLPKQLPGLEDFFMAGLWTMGSAGLPGAAITARDVVQILCAKDGKSFISE